jgi:hypothetical protein
VYVLQYSAFVTDFINDMHEFNFALVHHLLLSFLKRNIVGIGFFFIFNVLLVKISRDLFSIHFLPPPFFCIEEGQTFVPHYSGGVYIPQ